MAGCNGCTAAVPDQPPKCCCEGDSKKNVVPEIAKDKANEGGGSGCATNGACKCGPNCQCKPCNCEKS